MFVWEATDVVIMLVHFGVGGRGKAVESHRGGRRQENDQMWARGLDICAQEGGNACQTSVREFKLGGES